MTKSVSRTFVVNTLQDGEKGDTGRMYYPAGEYTSGLYTRDDNTCPVVHHAYTDNGTTVDEYWYLIADSNLVNGSYEEPTESATTWAKADKFGMVITEALFANFGKLGEWVFYGNYMMSSTGYDSVESEYNTDYQEFANSTWIPNVLFNALSGSGHFAGGKISFESNGGATIGGWSIEDQTISSGVISSGRFCGITLEAGSSEPMISAYSRGISAGSPGLYLSIIPDGIYLGGTSGASENNKTALLTDGSGWLASGKISFTSNGGATIGGWDVNSYGISKSASLSDGRAYSVDLAFGSDLNGLRLVSEPGTIITDSNSYRVDIETEGILFKRKSDSSSMWATTMKLGMDSSGWLANGNFYWDADGKITVKNGAQLSFYNNTYGSNVGTIYGTDDGKLMFTIGEWAVFDNDVIMDASLQVGSSVTATRFNKLGGESNEFLKADGSVDDTTYTPLSDTMAAIQAVLDTLHSDYAIGYSTDAQGNRTWRLLRTAPSA